MYSLLLLKVDLTKTNVRNVFVQNHVKYVIQFSSTSYRHLSTFTGHHTSSDDYFNCKSQQEFIIILFFCRTNFLPIDIFFRELSFMEIKQQEAYDLWAFFCK